MTPDANGVFNVLLGSVTPIESIPQSGNCWLEVTVGASVIAPRTRIVSAGYAYNAQEADNSDKLDGGHASAFAAAGHGHSVGGDLSGSVGSATVTGLQGRSVSNSAPECPAMAWSGTVRPGRLRL